MLQESADELDAGDRNMAQLLAAVIPIAERHPTVVDPLQAAVGDRHAKDIASQIIEHLLPVTRSLAVYHPFLFPDGWGNFPEQSCFFEGSAQLSAEDDRQSFDWNQKGGVLWRRATRSRRPRAHRQ